LFLAPLFKNNFLPDFSVKGKIFLPKEVLQQFPQSLHKKISTPIDVTQSRVHNPLTSRKELRGMVGATLKTSWI
jgi:hypothetical protein